MVENKKVHIFVFADVNVDHTHTHMHTHVHTHTYVHCKKVTYFCSLVPFRIHLPVARSCIENKVNMLTASYLSPEMKELHQQALDADITMFNEIGFDPGIDHMLSMQCFDEVHEKGGKVF